MPRNFVMGIIKNPRSCSSVFRSMAGLIKPFDKQGGRTAGFTSVHLHSINKHYLNYGSMNRLKQGVLTKLFSL